MTFWNNGLKILGIFCIPLNSLSHLIRKIKRFFSKKLDLHFTLFFVCYQGVLHESYIYDRSGRLSEVVFPGDTKLTYSFKDSSTTLPTLFTTERGHSFSINYDNIGALQSITTPRGHIHSFALQILPGATKFIYYSPVNRNPFNVLLDDQGRVTSKTYPGLNSRILYVYSNESRLNRIVAGISETEFEYYPTTGLLKSVDVKDRPFEVRHEFKYHGGLLKEERIRFGSKTGLDNLKSRCKYDGNFDWLLKTMFQ